MVRAIVVLRDGHMPSEALAAELQDHVERDGALHVPAVVEFADALPRRRAGRSGDPASV